MGMRSLFRYIYSKFISVLLSIKWRFKKKCRIAFNCRLNTLSCFEGSNIIHRNVTLLDSSIGYGTYIGMNSSFYKTTIGRYCSIASNVSILFGNHPTKTIVSTHPSFYSTSCQAGFTYVKNNIFEEYNFAEDDKFVKIGNDVWIGANVTILSGVTIGDGAIIGASSFVNTNVEPYTIYSGNPIQKVRTRFKEDEINYLLDIKWWNKPQAWIELNAEYFSDIQKFMLETRSKDSHE